jgi:hypothetical protein
MHSYDRSSFRTTQCKSAWLLGEQNPYCLLRNEMKSYLTALLLAFPGEEYLQTIFLS